MRVRPHAMIGAGDYRSSTTVEDCRSSKSHHETRRKTLTHRGRAWQSQGPFWVARRGGMQFLTAQKPYKWDIEMR